MGGVPGQEDGWMQKSPLPASPPESPLGYSNFLEEGQRESDPGGLCDGAAG